jgi:hypothetical protein
MKKFPKQAEDFHNPEDFAAPKGWSVQKWNLKDQCCGGGKIEVILPNDWSKLVEMALAEAKKKFPKEKFPPKKGDDGNSHLVYTESGYILQQALLFSSVNEDLLLVLSAKPKKICYTVYDENGDRDFPTFEKAFQLFQKKDKL